VLDRLADAVADGEEADWEEVGRRLGGGPEARLASTLRLVQAVQRKELASSSGRTLTAPAAIGNGAALTVAIRALLVLAGLQVAGAMAGAIAWLRTAPATHGVPAAPGFFVALAFGGAGAVLAHAGRRDRRALCLAGFFLGVASATSHRFLELAPAILPSFPGTLLTALLPETFLPFFLWSFAREFPRVVRLDRWAALVEAAVRVSGAVGVALFAVNAARSLLAWHGGWLDLLERRPIGLYWLLLSALCLPVPAVAWARARLANPEERRRVRLFLAGLGAGVLPLFAGVAGESLFPAFARFMSEPQRRGEATVLYLGLLTTLPVSTAYAVLAHHLLDLRWLLRRASRAARARRVLLLGAAPTLLLLAYLQHQRPRAVDQVLAEGAGPWMLVAAALGWTRIAWSRRVGRRFSPHLGGQASPGLALATFASDARHARTLAELAAGVRSRLCELVAAEHALLLPYDASSRSYWCTERRVRPLPAASSFARLLARSPAPLSLAEEGRDSVLPWLLEEDRQWVAEADAQLAIAVPAPQGDPPALLVLGAARGGLRYDRQDQQALAAFAATAALAVDRLARLEAPAGPGAAAEQREAGECLACGRVGPEPAGACPCGGTLGPAAIPLELGGKFRLLRVLGRGGMGVVYLADDLALSRKVALKTLPQLRTDALFRLRREARAMAGFVHPNLALILGLESWRGVPVLVVEYLAGGTLAARIGARIEAAQVLRWGVELAAAVEAMHAQGLLHRDIKPSNIGFTATAVPKLLDFGLAHLAAETGVELRAADAAASPLLDPALRSTVTGHVLGTPLYLSPEALAGAPPSPLNDLWALHVVLWEALAGRHPCAGMRLAAALRIIAAGELPDVRRVRPDCPAPVGELLAAGLRCKPRQRLPSAAAVRQALAEAVAAL
jgi:tRNA A-37 threonylcarbamoyl transferase component Bud32